MRILIVLAGLFAATAAAQERDPLMEIKVLLNAENFTSALPHIERAVAAGNAEAQYLYGDLYFYGDAVSQDYGQAKYWYTQAANMDHLAAAERLGDLYLSGDAWKKDITQAKHFYQIAATLGSAYARQKLTEINAD